VRILWVNLVPTVSLAFPLAFGRASRREREGGVHLLARQQLGTSGSTEARIEEATDSGLSPTVQGDSPSNVEGSPY
jgi:hypothetical protein